MFQIRHSVVVTRDYEQLHLDRLAVVLDMLASSPEVMSVQELSDALGVPNFAEQSVADMERRGLVSLSGTEISVTATGREFLETSKRRYAGPLYQALDAKRSVPITLIGYWEGPSAPGWPRAQDFVDHDWNEWERDIVASYLEEGFIPSVGCGISDCRFCGAPNGSAERSDGVYVWPEGLAHYVREHGVRLPVSVIRHMVGRSLQMNPDREDSTWWKRATLDS